MPAIKLASPALDPAGTAWAWDGYRLLGVVHVAAVGDDQNAAAVRMWYRQWPG